MLHITVSNDRQRLQVEHELGALELGRGPQREIERLVIEDVYVSRDQLRIEQIANARVRLENLGGPATMADGSALASGETRELDFPIRLSVGYSTIDIVGETAVRAHETRLPADHENLQTITPPLHLSSDQSGEASQETILAMGDAISVSTLTHWFETVVSVQRSAAGSNEFYQETAQAVVDLVGLDRGLVLLRKDDGWEVIASHPPQTATSETGRAYSHYVLGQVVDQQRTFFRRIDESSSTHSLMGVESVVASPVFDDRGEVIGAAYGSRKTRGTVKGPGIRPLEAQVVQLLAAAVTTGLARMEREAEATRNRVQFEQFCSPKLAGALERNPKLLEGHESEVTVMFCDVRSFSQIAERLTTRQSYGLLSDAMDCLTEQIIQFDGIVIDYYGDGVAAMWNAPEQQQHHAELACRAAQAMCAALPKLRETWGDTLGAPLNVGIGIHSGSAQVGNAGSRRRMKYGPQGHTVNLASRVEGATKVFGVPVLITGSTQKQLPSALITRRLAHIRVVNIAGAVTVYELGVQPEDPQWLSRRDAYEEALACYETGDWAGGLALLEAHEKNVGSGEDVPTKMLSDRLTACLQQPPEKFDPVIELKSK